LPTGSKQFESSTLKYATKQSIVIFERPNSILLCVGQYWRGKRRPQASIYGDKGDGILISTLGTIRNIPFPAGMNSA
jgi:hypothetical protein